VVEKKRTHTGVGVVEHSLGPPVADTLRVPKLKRRLRQNSLRRRPLLMNSATNS